MPTITGLPSHLFRPTARSVTNAGANDTTLRDFLRGNSPWLLLNWTGETLSSWLALSVGQKKSLIDRADTAIYQLSGDLYASARSIPQAARTYRPHPPLATAHFVYSDAALNDAIGIIDAYCARLLGLPAPLGPVSVNTIAAYALHDPEGTLRTLGYGGCRDWIADPDHGFSRLYDHLPGDRHDVRWRHARMDTVALLDNHCAILNIPNQHSPIPTAVRTWHPAGQASSYTQAASYTNGPTLLAAAVAFAGGYAACHFFGRKRV